MRIACAAGHVVVHTDYDLACLGARAFRAALVETRTWSPTVGAPEVPMPIFARQLLAIAPSGKAIVASRKTSAVDRSDLVWIDRTQRAGRELAVDAATFLDDDTLLTIESGSLFADGRPIVVPAPKRVVWPTGAGRIWNGAPPWDEGHLGVDATISSNAFGHVVTDARAGVIVLVNRRATAATAFRVPAEGDHSEIVVEAFATADGFVVAHGGGRSAGAINVFDSDGAHRAGLPIQGNVSDVVVGATDLAFVREADGVLEVVRAALPSLLIGERTPTALPPYEGYPALAIDANGTLWAGNGSSVVAITDREARAVTLPASYVVLGDAPPPPPRPVAPTTPKAARIVEHPKFGRGTVIAQDGDGPDAKLEITFASGTKKLQAKFVVDVR